MRFAVPSHLRAAKVTDFTLASLSRAGIPRESVDVWVRAEEEEEYRVWLPQEVTLRTHDSPVGVVHARNSISAGYEDGEQVVSFDDDIRGFFRMLDGPREPWRGGCRPYVKKLIPLTSLRPHLEYGFELLEQAGFGLFGLNYTGNPLATYMRVTTAFRIVTGAAYGFVAPGIPVSFDEHEDCERSALYQLRDGGVVTLDYVTFRSRVWKERGGMQSYRTEEDRIRQARSLVERYPTLLAQAKNDPKRVVATGRPKGEWYHVTLEEDLA